MQKFGSLDRWKLVKAGQAIELPVARKVRLEVSTPPMTHWHVGADYLTTTNGHDVLEFVAKAGMKITAVADVRLKTAEGQKVHIENPGSAPYTKIASRRDRNPELERVAMMAAENATRRLSQMHREEMRLRDQQIKQMEMKGERVDPETGEIIDTSTSGTDGPAAVSKKGSENTAPNPKVDQAETPANAGKNKGGKGGGLPNSDAPVDE